MLITGVTEDDGRTQVPGFLVRSSSSCVILSCNCHFDAERMRRGQNAETSEDKESRRETDKQRQMKRCVANTHVKHESVLCYRQIQRHVG